MMSDMLASLLPGLRDIRAPLSSGYIWVGVLWVSLSGRWTHPSSDPLLAGIARLGVYAGKPVVLGAVTFGAYVVGVLSCGVSNALLPWSMPLLLRLRRTRTDDMLGEAATAAWAEVTAGEPVGFRLEGPKLHEELRWLVITKQVLHRDLVLIPARLPGADPALFDRYDRCRADAEFRMAIALPSVACALMVWSRSPALRGLTAPLFGVTLCLVWLAWQSRDQAEVALAEAVRSGRVATSTLDQVASYVAVLSAEGVELRRDEPSYQRLVGDARSPKWLRDEMRGVGGFPPFEPDAGSGFGGLPATPGPPSPPATGPSTAEAGTETES
jgi:hypothetical protein